MYGTTNPDLESLIFLLNGIKFLVGKNDVKKNIWILNFNFELFGNNLR